MNKSAAVPPKKNSQNEHRFNESKANNWTQSGKKYNNFNLFLARSAITSHIINNKNYNFVDFD